MRFILRLAACIGGTRRSMVGIVSEDSAGLDGRFERGLKWDQDDLGRRGEKGCPLETFALTLHSGAMHLRANHVDYHIPICA